MSSFHYSLLDFLTNLLMATKAIRFDHFLHVDDFTRDSLVMNPLDLVDGFTKFEW